METIAYPFAIYNQNLSIARPHFCLFAAPLREGDVELATLYVCFADKGEIVRQQSLAGDAVSDATNSSKVIKKAVEAALTNAE